jgi:hypothetical protein
MILLPKPMKLSWNIMMGHMLHIKDLKNMVHLLKRGKKIYPRTPLAVLKNGNTKLTFELYYLYAAKFEFISNNLLSSKGCKYAYLTPYFYTSEGYTKLEPNKKYTVDFTDEILMKELTRRERRKLNK